MADVWLISVTTATIVYAIGAWLVARRHREPGLYVVLIMLPMWTTFAAYSIISAKGPRGSGTSSYLESVLFPIELDPQYALALSMYFLFSYLFLLFVGGLPVMTPEARQRQKEAVARLVEAFPFAWAAVGLSAGIAAQNAIANSIAGELQLKSLYGAAQNELISSAALRLLTYVNIANSGLLAVVSALLVVGLTLKTRVNRFRLIGLCLLMIAALQYQINLTLGDRGTTLMLVLAVIVGAARFGNWNALRNTAIGTRIALVLLAGMALYAVPLIGMLRTASSSGRGLRGSVLSAAVRPGDVMGDIFGGADLAAAHFSLYGVIGIGRSSLDSAVYPFITNSYQSYQDLLNLPTGQGFTIHQVASWFLSVGAFAPLFAALYGALVIGLYLWIGRREITKRSAPWVFTANSWALVAFPTAFARSGPEGLRGTLTAGLLLPTVSALAFWWVAWRRSATADGASVDHAHGGGSHRKGAWATGRAARIGCDAKARRFQEFRPRGAPKSASSAVDPAAPTSAAVGPPWGPPTTVDQQRRQW